jgi:glyoxylase-like metal-dependent hydrolase (beta-lactamase superfamily II)
MNHRYALYGHRSVLPVRRVLPETGRVDITTLTSSAEGLLSNTHLVSAPDGIIVIDPPMLLSDARAVRARLDQLGRPLAAFVYTHPHPDHVNGATEIRGTAEVPGYATAETDRISRMIDGPKREFWTPVFGDDYPPATTFATVLVTGGTSVKIAGLSFDVHDIGPGECETASLWISGDAAFVGDLAYSNAHPWLFEARTSTWLEQLARVRPLLQDKTLYVGHGAAGPVALLDAQADYIRAYQQTVGELAAADGTLTTAAKETLRERMTGLWPGAPLQDLITMSADPVAAELAAAH